MRIALTIGYRGTAFCGWQYQPGRRTVQGVLRDAVLRASGETVTLHGAGRTDAGVHALGQVAHFDTNAAIPPAQWARVLNNFLPPDVRIVDSRAVPETFHARKSAHEKTYMYAIFVSETPRAMLWDLCWIVPPPLDIGAMRSAAELFVGTHDFAAFRSAGSSAKTTVRTVAAMTVEPMPDAILRDGTVTDGGVTVRVSADGFLYNMVRVLTAQLVLVGQGRRTERELLDALAARDRARVRECAPACGLTLERVVYPD